MKYYGRVAILIPYVSDKDTPEWFRINIEAREGIDRRKVLRGTRRFIQDNFGVKVSNDFIKKRIQIIFEPADAPSRFKTVEEKTQFMDKLVLAIQEEEDKYAAQNGGYSESEAEVPCEAGVEVPSL